MKKPLLAIAIISGQMLIATCAQAQLQTITTTTVISPAQPYCREYTQTLKIGNALQQAYGTACRQPDGSWQLIPSGGQAGQQPAPNITYIVRDNGLYYMPPYPAFDVQIFGNFRHGEKRGGYWRDEGRHDHHDRFDNYRR